MSSESPVPDLKTKATGWRVLKIPIQILIALVVLFVVLAVLSFLVDAVATAISFTVNLITGALAGIPAGVLEALDRADFADWYLNERAQIYYRPENCVYLTGERLQRCRGFNIGATKVVDTWNAVMAHKASRAISAFLFPILLAVLLKKLVEELWDGAKGKKKAEAK